MGYDLNGNGLGVLEKDEGINAEIARKKEELFEVEKEQQKLNEEMKSVFEKIADIKLKVAAKAEALFDESFINLVAKNKICSDLAKKIKELKLSGSVSEEELEKAQEELSEFENERIKAKEKSDSLREKVKKFKADADEALKNILKRS